MPDSTALVKSIWLAARISVARAGNSEAIFAKTAFLVFVDACASEPEEFFANWILSIAETIALSLTCLGRKPRAYVFATECSRNICCTGEQNRYTGFGRNASCAKFGDRSPGADARRCATHFDEA